MAVTSVAWAELFRAKAAGYTTLEQVAFALDDIAATLYLLDVPGDVPNCDSFYLRKLYEEQDALMLRRAELENKPTPDMVIADLRKRLEFISQVAAKLDRLIDASANHYGEQIVDACTNPNWKCTTITAST